MLNAIMLNVIMLNVIILNVIMLNVIILNVIMLSVVMVSVVEQLPLLAILNKTLVIFSAKMCDHFCNGGGGGF